MSFLFLFISLASIASLIVGLVRPIAFIRIGITTRKRALVVFSTAALLSFFLAVLTLDTPTPTTQKQPSQTTQNANPAPIETLDETADEIEQVLSSEEQAYIKTIGELNTKVISLLEKAATAAADFESKQISENRYWEIVAETHDALLLEVANKVVFMTPPAGFEEVHRRFRNGVNLYVSAYGEMVLSSDPLIPLRDTANLDANDIERRLASFTRLFAEGVTEMEASTKALAELGR